MSKGSIRQGRLASFLFKWRWMFVVALGVVVILVEMQEHGNLAAAAANPHLWREVLLFGILSPLAYGLILEILLHTREERARVVHELDQQRFLNHRLSQIRDWQELIRTIVEFPQRILPVAATSLRVYDAEHDRYELAGFWALEGHKQALWHVDVPRQDCRQCTAMPSPGTRFLTPCARFTDAQFPRRYTSFCLPLIHQDETVALLHLHFVGEPTLLSQQVKTLASAAPEMALAIESLHLQRMAIVQKEAASAERQRIARDLHDTLGQSIGYLRLKLDQLVDGDSLREISAIRGELEHMRAVADEAYHQVRSTLSELQSENALALNQALLDHLRQVSTRAGLEGFFEMRGEPRSLPALMKRQILYIYREMLNNVEKHAQAKTIHVTLEWGEASLGLEVVDDGVGFDPQAEIPEGHYGLQIMQERTQDLKGSMMISSALNAGTRLRLEVPYDCPAGNSNLRVASEMKN